MGGRALPTLAYKLDRHTRSDYLDCHIYLERGAIHHSSAADSTRPMLIPSGGESSLSQPCVRWCLLIHPFDIGSTPPRLTLPRKKMQALLSVSPQERHGRGRVYTGQKAECIWRTCLCPSLPPSETTLSSRVTLGKWFHSVAQHCHGIYPNWRNVLDLCCPQPRGRATCGCGVLHPWPCKEKLSLSLT